MADRISEDNEGALLDSLQPETGEPPNDININSVLFKLYTSHFLSTWNSRTFEFGAVLFIAEIRPGTLLYVSLYALIRSLAATLFSSRVGMYVDRASRLSSVRASIVWQRIPVATSCVLFGALIFFPKVGTLVFGICFLIAILLACFEKLAIIGNTIAVERDWVVVISEALNVKRPTLNATMRRIDLGCKLLAPVVISFIHSYSAMLAILTVLVWNSASVLVEYFAIARVYYSISELSAKTASQNCAADVPEDPQETSVTPTSGSSSLTSFGSWIAYFSSSVFLASFSLTLLYLTVLSVGIQYQAYMLSIGFSAITVSLLRLAAVASELSATCITPFLMKRIGSVRAGLWSINGQVIFLSIGVAVFRYYDGNSKVAGIGLTCGIVLSRLGLWGIDLAVQDLVQEGTPESKRGEFSATEMALQNFFELLSYGSTVVFPNPSQFQIPVFISLGAVVLSAVCYAAYVRKERGHLVHLSHCVEGRKYRRLSRSGSPESIDLDE